ncbi:hypothetical protein BJ912DRAFT_1056422 [Pholiota molesta]|nr:hypothetical protein BJ912DRAFT_1056422 [Pholiota molesta]
MISGLNVNVHAFTIQRSTFNIQPQHQPPPHLTSSPTRAPPFREGYRKGKMEVGETREQETQQHLFTVAKAARAFVVGAAPLHRFPSMH